MLCGTVALIEALSPESVQIQQIHYYWIPYRNWSRKWEFRQFWQLYTLWQCRSHSKTLRGHPWAACTATDIVGTVFISSQKFCSPKYFFGNSIFEIIISRYFQVFIGFPIQIDDLRRFSWFGAHGFNFRLFPVLYTLPRWSHSPRTLRGHAWAACKATDIVGTVFILRKFLRFSKILFFEPVSIGNPIVMEPLDLDTLREDQFLLLWGRL